MSLVFINDLRIFSLIFGKLVGTVDFWVYEEVWWDFEGVWIGLI